MTVHVIDGNNQFRIKFETAGTIKSIIAEQNGLLHFQDQIFWIWDGHGAKKRRRDVYPIYKGNRKPAPDDFYLMMDLFKQCLLYTRSIQLEVPTYEADDVIGQLVPQLVEDGEEVIIHSTDGDFAILADGVKVKLWGRNEYPNVDYLETRLYKATRGDPSDNIKGVPGFGDKSWEKSDHDRWLQLFTDPDYKPDFRAEAGSYGISMKIADWLSDKTNLAFVKAGWEVAGFYKIPEELIAKHLVVGTHNDKALNEILKDFML